MTAPEIVAVVATVGGAGAGGWLAWIAARFAWLRAFWERFHAIKAAVVLEIRNTYVEALKRAKDPTSPGGTSLTPEEATEALRKAVDRFVDMIGLGALERAMKIMGLERSTAFIREWLATWVEAEVKDLSIREVVANGAAPAKVAAVAFEAVRRASAELAAIAPPPAVAEVTTTRPIPRPTPPR